MATIKHTFQSAKADGGDTTQVRPSNWNADHDVEMAATDTVLGRQTAGPGPAEEIPCKATARALMAAADAAAARTAIGVGAVGALDTVDTAHLDNQGVTPAKVQNVSGPGKALGRKTAGAGSYEELSLSDVLDFIGSATKGDILVRDTAAWVRLVAGNAGYVLQSQGAAQLPSYQNVAALQITKIGKAPPNGVTGNVRYFVTGDNSLYAVGANANLQNGYQGANTGIPLRVAFNVQPAAISKVVYGEFSTYILDTAGHVWSMGGNANGQLGHGDTTARDYAQRVEYFVTNSITISDIIVGGSDYSGGTANVFFISSTGALYACGDNANGQLGTGGTVSLSTPAQVIASGVASVCASIGSGVSNNTLVVKTDNTLWGTGGNAMGCLGFGDTTQRTSFAQITTGVAKALNIGTYAGSSIAWSIILKTNGTIWTCGYNGDGELGQGDTTDRHSFTQVGAATNWVDIYGTDGHSGTVGAKNSANELWVWGYNGYGQLGLGDTTNRTSPTKPTFAGQGLVTDVRMAGGDTTSQVWVYCSDGNIYGAGYGANANLGRNSSTAVNNTFSAMMGMSGTLSDWTTVGWQDAAALTVLLTDGTCLVHGYNSFAQLGLNVSGNAQHLVRVPRFA